MQNAKDSFYEVLRDRLSRLNPERTVVVRGITRPGVVVDENESMNVAPLADCFHLRWTGLQAAEEANSRLVTQTCEISYATAGSSWSGGLDRGRALSAMDAELFSAIHEEPRNAPKCDYSPLAAGGSATLMSTRIWWSGVSFKEAGIDGDRIQRVAAIEVMSYQEEGETR
jgi:hypothetical protein